MGLSKKIMDNFTATPQLAKKLNKTLGKLFINNTCHFKPTSSTVKKECDGTYIVLAQAYYTPGYC